MKNLSKEEQLALFKAENQVALINYIKEGNLLAKEAQLLMFDHPKAVDLILNYLGSGHVLSQEALLKVFSLNPMHAQLIMELCIAYGFLLSKEVQLKLFELTYPKAIIRWFIRQNKGTNNVTQEVYLKAKALRYI